MWGVQTNYVVKVPTYSALLPKTAVQWVPRVLRVIIDTTVPRVSRILGWVAPLQWVPHILRGVPHATVQRVPHTLRRIPHTICGVFHTLICSEFRTFSGSLLTLLCRSSAHNCTVSFLHILLSVPYSIDNELCTFLMSSSQYCIVSSAHSAGCSSNYFAASSIHSLIMWWVQYGVLKPNASCAVIKNLRKYIKIQVTFNTNFVSVTFKNSATLTPTDFFYVKSRNCEFKGK